MSLNREQLEPWLRHKLGGKGAKRKSHKWQKNQFNRWLRRKMKNIDFMPNMNQYSGWEY